jgi:antitoxin (DNA-binding transcriptional repressor) of toxin-antitoxin stability system
MEGGEVMLDLLAEVKEGRSVIVSRAGIGLLPLRGGNERRAKSGALAS